MNPLGPASNGFYPVDPAAERALEAWAMAGPKFPRPRPARSAGQMCGCVQQTAAFKCPCEAGERTNA